MEGLITIVVILLIIRFGGSLLEGLFASVGALGKLGGIILGVVLVYLFLTGGGG